MSFYKSTILQDGPVAYWRLGELTGTTAVDVQGVANGIYTGGVALLTGQSGAIAGDNDAAIFNPGNFYGVTLNAASALNLGGSSCTLECWVRTSNSGSFQHLIGAYSPGSPFNGYGLGTGAQTAGKLSYWPGSGINWIESTASVTDGNWHYLAVTISATQTIMYVDATSNGVIGDFRPTSYTGTRILAARSDVAAALVGRLDEVAIYNYALSAARIKAHYQAGIASGLIAPPVGNCPFIRARAA